MKPLLCLAALAACAFAQDPMLGTWRLSPSESSSKKLSDTYNGGVRTYTAVPGGVRVTWQMRTGDDTTRKGHYTVQCDQQECSSKIVRWTIKNPREADGEDLNHGKVVERFTRIVSEDGKKMTISFFDPKSPGGPPIAVQVWEREQLTHR